MSECLHDMTHDTVLYSAAEMSKEDVLQAFDVALRNATDRKVIIALDIAKDAVSRMIAKTCRSSKLERYGNVIYYFCPICGYWQKETNGIWYCLKCGQKLRKEKE